MIIKIKNKKIGYNYPPIIIAEISSNHNGCKKKFLELIKNACINGADFIKIQTYEPKDITLKGPSKKFLIKEGIWKNKHLWNLYKKACTPFSWHKDAFKLATKYNKTIFSTPFSLRAVDLLEGLNCKLYKIASFEITDLKLIRYIASKKKPIIISTGMASVKEIKKAINEIKRYHNKIILMHCVSSYPTKLEDINLNRINMLKRIYKDLPIGLSDHTNDIISAIASIPIGVVAIEKHFKLDNKTNTPDSLFSITPDKLKTLKIVSKDIHKSFNKKNTKIEKISKNLRRSIFAKKNIEKNQKLTTENIETLRPSIGICASKYFEILNKKTKVKIKSGAPIFKNMIKN